MIRKETAALIGIITLKFSLQYIVTNSIYELHKDELLYLDQANHLAWGYVSIPPFTSWVSFIIKLLGNSVFWIKFFPALFGALTILVVWKTIDVLKGSFFAKILGATCCLFSTLLHVNTLFQPCSFDILSWVAVFFFSIKYISSQKPKWLYWAAICLGIGFLNKYNIAFLVFGTLPALLISNQRTLFLKKEFYYALGITLLIVFPNLLWQYNNTPSLFHHLSELAKNQFTHIDRLNFFRNQLLFFTGSMIVIIVSLYSLLFYKPFKKIRFLFWTFIFTLVLFLSFGTESYYAVGLYPVYISIGAVYFSKISDKCKWEKIFFNLVLIILPIVIFIYIMSMVPLNKPPKYVIENREKYLELGLLYWEDGNIHEIPQELADMLGWKELAGKVDKAYLNIKSTGETLVLCDNYGQAGAINFYSKHSIQAISFDADYINWFNPNISYSNLIRVKNRKDRNNELEETSPFFQSSFIADSITNKYSREFGTTIFVFQKSNINLNERIENEIGVIKKHR